MIAKKVLPPLARLLTVLALMLSLLPANVSASFTESPPVHLASFTGQFINGPHSPSISIDSASYAASFVVNPGDFHPAAVIEKVTLWINFAKVGGSDCPGMGTGDDWAEEISFTLQAPDGTSVPLVSQNDYLYSNPAVGYVEVLFDDDGPYSVVGRQISSGTFKSRSGQMHLFNGLNPVGEWFLVLQDSFFQDPLCYVEGRLNITVSDVVDLGIQKTVAPVVGIAGQELLYTVTAWNSGPDPASNVVVTDVLPAGLIFMGATLPCTEFAGTLTCSIGDLAVGETRSFTIKALVDPGLVSDQIIPTLAITNQVSIAAPGISETNPDDNSFSLTSLVQDSADLLATQIMEPEDTVLAGQTMTMTVFVDNLGPSFARNVRFQSSALSSGDFEAVAILDDPARSDSCTVSPAIGVQTETSTITCSLLEPLEPQGVSGPVSSTGRYTVKIILRSRNAPDISAVTEVFTYEDSATGYPGTPDPELSNNQAQGFTSILATADLQAFSVFGAEVQVNGLPGKILDTNSLPAMPDPTCCNFGGTTVTPGRRIQWDTSTLNNGPSTAQNVKIEVLLPYGAAVIENTLTGAPNPGLVPGRCTTEPEGELRRKVVCEYGSLNSGQQAALRFQALVDPGLPQGTQLSFDSRATSQTFDLNLSNNLTSIQFDAQPWADLSVQKYGNPNPIPAGTATSYDILVNHKGPSTAVDALLTDVLPVGMTPLNAQIVSGGLPGSACLLRTGDPALQDSVYCDLGDLPPGSQVHVVVSAWVKPGAAAGTVTNTAWVTADVAEPYPSDNSASVDTTISPSADLRLAKSADPIKVFPGQQVKFSLLVENAGPSSAQDVAVTDLLPAGMTYETSSFSPFASPQASSANKDRWSPALPAGAAPQAACGLVSSDPDVVTCSIGDLQPGEKRLVSIWARVSPDVLPGTTLVNSAEALGSTPDPDPANNSDYVEVFVQGVDLALSKTATGQVADGVLVTRPDEVSYGFNLTYEIQVANLGGLPALNVVLKDFLPGGVTLVSLAPSQGVCLNGVPGNPAHPTTCNLGSLQGGATATVVIVVNIPQSTPAGTTLYNYATLDSDSNDMNNLNDVAANTSTVVAADFRIYLGYLASSVE
ncbi:MAG: DUF11 domain-containing protein [Anaerolineales bacterium]|nr:DUF11 domain-containing protein [Anaerolineales bacterium]